ncbi:MAG: hypothetical protein ACKVJK_09465 [Methylophagaceae bacterium]|jgi:DNA-binding PadR family transcriptional regulator|tara:strand:+ start:92 stop:541 length:450 start_codon:yes stop_codon:yes gene_type:complete
MERGDFVKRGELKVDFLKYYRLVSRWACKQYEISISDLELLFYLDPIKYFTLEDFRDGTLYYHWDRQRFYRLQREGWLEKIHKGNGRLGDHNKYKVSLKGHRLTNRIYKILIGEEDIPEDAKRSKVHKRETYVDKVYSNAISKFNKKEL